MLNFKCKHYCECNVNIELCNIVYPHRIFAYALLLNGEIGNWWVGEFVLGFDDNIYDIWEIDRVSDYKMIKTSWEVRASEEYDRVFNILSAEWFKQWKVLKGFKGFRPY